MSDLRSKLFMAKMATYQETKDSLYLTGTDEDAHLSAEASSVFLSWFTLWGLSKEEKALRRNMIKSSDEVIKKLKDIEYLLASKEEDKSTDAMQTLINLFLSTFISDFNQLSLIEQNKNKALLSQPSEQSGEQTQSEEELNSDLEKDRPKTYREETNQSTRSPVSESNLEELQEEANPNEDALNKIREINKKFNTELQEKMQSVISGLEKAGETDELKKFKARERKFGKELANASVKENFEKLPELLQELNVLESEIQRLNELIAKKASDYIGEDIYKVANSAISRWIKKKLLELSSDMISQLYLKTIDDITNIYEPLKEINKNLINKDIQISSYKESVKFILEKMKSVVNRLIVLLKNSIVLDGKPGVKRSKKTELERMSKILDSHINLFLNLDEEQER